MARSSYRLDMKRDDPRTLMIKMDARLTFAGRERNHAFRMEEERELRHLDYARHLTRSSLERQQKEMHKRMDFLKTLVEENRLRRKKMEDEDREKLTEDVDNGVLAEKRKRKEISLRHTLPVMPVRRNLEELVSSLQGQRKQKDGGGMSRSLGYLSESFSQHKMKDSLSEKRLRQLRQEMRDARKKDAPVPKVQVTGENDTPSSESPKVVWARKDGATNGSMRAGSNDGVARQTILLPDISGDNARPRDDAQAFSQHKGRRVSLSQMIASGEITKLPGINSARSTVAAGAPQNLNLARTFYMNTSQTSARSPAFQQDSSSKRGWVKLPQNTLPLKFLQEDVKQNPFMSSDFKPDTNRSRELLDSKKPEEMYVWLGFDSEEEYMKMLQEAKEELDAEDDDGDDLIELEVIDEVGEGDGGIEKEGAEYLKKRRMSRRVSRLSAPVAMIASSLSGGLGGKKQKPTSALRKFIKAAKTICVVRQFQLTSTEKQGKT